MSDIKVKVSVDDPERDNRINRDSTTRRLCELDQDARQNGKPRTFTLDEIWKFQKAFDQDTYSRSTMDELMNEDCVYKDEENKFGLTDKGRMKYCR